MLNPDLKTLKCQKSEFLKQYDSRDNIKDIPKYNNA